MSRPLSNLTERLKRKLLSGARMIRLVGRKSGVYDSGTSIFSCNICQPAAFFKGISGYRTLQLRIQEVIITGIIQGVMEIQLLYQRIIGLAGIFVLNRICNDSLRKGVEPGCLVVAAV